MVDLNLQLVYSEKIFWNGPSGNPFDCEPKVVGY